MTEAGEVAPRPRAQALVPVGGVHCAACVDKVERAARAVDGVSRAELSFATRRLLVEFDAGTTDLERVARAVAKAGYALDLSRDAGTRRAREEREERAAGLRLRVAFALSVPLVAIAMTHGAIPALDGAWAEWLQFALATVVVAWCGAPIHRAALARLLARTSDMNTLVSLGTLVAWGSSAWTLVAGSFGEAHAHAGAHALHFEAAAVIVAFVLLGRMLETRATHRAGEALRELAALASPAVRAVGPDGAERTIGAGEVVPGVRVRIRPGERVPVDGEIVAGETEVDESMLTGEPEPLLRTAGDRVVAGTLNTVGTIDVEATRASHETVLAAIVDLVERAQASKANIARVADRVAAVFVPAVIAVALAAAGLWLLLGPAEIRAQKALEALVGVLVVACPCALGLATPVAIMVASGRLARDGVLLRSAAALESLAAVREVVLDKTGTLTLGAPRVERVIPVQGVEASELLAIAASCERPSEHPVARGIVEEARARGATVAEASEFRAIAGKGVLARVETNARSGVARAGTLAWLAAEGVEVEPLARCAPDTAGTLVAVAIDRTPLGWIALRDEARAESKAALAELARLGIATTIASGDRAAAVESLARDLGVEPARAHGGLSPEGKAALLAQFRASGVDAAFVGDGINDAPALAAARPGIAMGAGTDIAKSSAEVLLVRSDLAQIPRSIAIARRTMSVIRQNLVWAFGYNLVLVPLAAGALWPWTGAMLPPVAASAAMALSSVTVVVNSLRLRSR
jgi:Cu+-exporting ATPase